MAVVKLIWLIKNKKQITVVSDRHGLERMSKIRKRGEWKLEPHRYLNSIIFIIKKIFKNKITCVLFIIYMIIVFTASILKCFKLTHF